MKIVMVDSSRVGLKIISEMLKGQSYDIHTFTDGREAFEFIQKEPDVNLLLTGLELPSLSGLELCWEIQLMNQQGRHIYIIAMSSNHDECKLSEALDSGADEFITKPPRVQELMARLRVAQRMQTMQNELIKQATIDSLTGILNRRAFFDRAICHCNRANDGEPLSAIMFDIDHFKRINDRFGHDIGDMVLSRLVKVVNQERRLFARMGGEEFILLLPSLDQAEAMEAAEEVRRGVEQMRFDVGGGALQVTCSFGVSEWGSEDSIDSLMKRADLALYLAKESGRNQVRFGKHNIDDVVPERTLDDQVFYIV